MQETAGETGVVWSSRKIASSNFSTYHALKNLLNQKRPGHEPEFIMSESQSAAKMMVAKETEASLENLIESVDLGIEVLHPGGPETSKELAEHCHVGAGTRVLDVASGTGQTACHLAETFHCKVVGVDASDSMLERARNKAGERHLEVQFRHGDAQRLPFESNSFDVVISECTLCILDKETAIREMIRVARPGGYIGMHDLCWRDGAPENLKDRLAESRRSDRRPSKDGSGCSSRRAWWMSWRWTNHT